MQKPTDLRAAITAAYPQIGRDADRLNMWVEEGRIRSPMTVNQGFGWEYTLNITIVDMTIDPSIVFLAINAWLAANQPDLLASTPGSGYRFEADMLDPQTIDLHVTLKLTENVALITQPDGTRALQYLAEPNLDWVNGTDYLTAPPRTLASVIPVPATIPVQFPNPAAGE